LRLFGPLLAAAVATAGLAPGAATRASDGVAPALRPDRVVAIRQIGPSGPIVLRADLTGQGPGTAVVRAGAPGAATLTVTAGGRVLLRVAGVGGVGLLAFAHHTPVLVTQTDMCGSGGCFYVGYTYVPAAGRLEAIAGAVGLVGPRLTLRGRRWVPVGPPSTAFWGFARLDAGGLRFSWRTYDAENHRGHRQYVYVPRAGAAGSWRATGAPWFTPDAPLSGSYAGAGTVVGAATRFLAAVCLGLPVEAASVAGSGLGRRLYAAARRALAACAYPNPAVTRVRATRAASGPWTVVLRLSTQGMGVPLAAYAVRLRVAAKPTPKVTAIAATVIPLRVRTDAQALAALAATPAIRAWVGAHPGVVAQLPVSSGATAWQETFILPGGQLAFATVNARSGAVTAPRA